MTERSRDRLGYIRVIRIWLAWVFRELHSFFPYIVAEFTFGFIDLHTYTKGRRNRLALRFWLSSIAFMGVSKLEFLVTPVLVFGH